MKVRACCTWSTFEGGFLATWDRGSTSKSVRPPRELIDWDLARRHWQRYAMTGGEAARVQLQALSEEAIYLYRWHRPSDDGGDGGGGGPDVPSPAPCPVLVRC